MKQFSLSTKVAIGFVIGIVLGLIFKEDILIIKPIGTIFLTLIKMIVVPLVFFSIASSVAGIDNIQRLRRIGTQTLLYYVLTTLIAGCIGLFVAHLLKPGAGIDIAALPISAQTMESKEIPGIGQTLVGMFPANPFQSLVEGNLVQVIVFSLFLGISVVLLGEKAQLVKNLMNTGTEVMYKMTSLVMAFSPYGVAALIACSIGEYGIQIFGPLARFILTDYLGLLAVILSMYLLMLKFIAKVPVGMFFKKILPIWAVTASTTSSSGTLPVTTEIVEKKMGVHNELAQFTLPVGATMNMNGAVVYYAAAVIFVSQIYGVELDLTSQIILILLTALVSIGSPGIPGGGIVMTVMLLSTMGLPLEIMGLIAGMYRILDMGHTTLNVTGDVVSTLCIARKENMLDQEIFKS
ncbi:dicarboxylate/amino acid:cation symporter [Neisseria animalis]|uniref:Dicarboxylate/amino acid:cation symporter n=2 Tax=Neisseria animalis TaxID=492 RepID=A0A5P3MVC5_NEIAN|nr:dicarboxylate/amino acid:cation symporter [Neisseria animalis]ROW31709.1 dicarboxylate/amino acid:cation symporter [Neisseria animalis]VEE07863.1 serine/threonine transporter SstT [Neisseria animalis]